MILIEFTANSGQMDKFGQLWTTQKQGLSCEIHARNAFISAHKKGSHCELDKWTKKVSYVFIVRENLLEQKLL